MISKRSRQRVSRSSRLEAVASDENRTRIRRSSRTRKPRVTFSPSPPRQVHPKRDVKKKNAGGLKHKKAKRNIKSRRKKEKEELKEEEYEREEVDLTARNIHAPYIPMYSNDGIWEWIEDGRTALESFEATRQENVVLLSTQRDDEDSREGSRTNSSKDSVSSIEDRSTNVSSDDNESEPESRS
ncbi:unnamed protein product [Caenorhabditis auriculariae]|uniref:Uncharacterized protein n=1 Tax=Caenorhabditis auriculariae TaxID=2777116 RepID=A0A8S1H837_9PELO|nr:unnamed protein product [Caenorhabditis auriculariae]